MKEHNDKNLALRNDALDIIFSSIKKADPYLSTLNILKTLNLENLSPTVLSIGKAAVPMAKAAEDVFGEKIKTGLIVTKYGHSKGFSSKIFEVIESAHPVSDENSVLAAEKGLEIVSKLSKNDVLVVILSGGGSALFEKSNVSFETQRDITKKLLSRGAEIEEINAVRSCVSLVKGGKLAAAAYPAKVLTVALSDVLGNNKGAIASGITVAMPTDKAEIRRIAEKYLPEYAALLAQKAEEVKTPKVNDGGFFFAGDINSLCLAAEERAKELGYFVADSSRSLTGEARDAAKKLIALAKDRKGKTAYIFGGETTVTLKGSGLGGRNQEMALAAAIELSGKENIVFASAGSDGTDGPTDAAGGIADGRTVFEIQKAGFDAAAELENNNSYYALKAADSLIFTGPTGTNVNDLTLILTDF